jgi:hypothetical protein
MINRTLTAVLDAPKEAVFDYLASIDNLPSWATEFVQQVRYEDGTTKVVNALGEFHFELRADAETGVIDMLVGPTKESLALFPTRVVPLGPGKSAYSFTMFKAADMPDELFESQFESLRREFDNIRAHFASDHRMCTR